MQPPRTKSAVVFVIRGNSSHNLNTDRFLANLQNQKETSGRRKSGDNFRFLSKSILDYKSHGSGVKVFFIQKGTYAGG